MLNLKKGDWEKVRQSRRFGKSAREINRAHVLNLSSKNYSHIEISDILEMTPRTVSNILQKYRESGLEAALHDDPRPGPPPKFDDRIESKIVALVCSDLPEGFDRWTLELLREKAVADGVVDSISKETIRVILQEHDLKPWQQKMWCIPKLDEIYIERMENILDLYEKPEDPECPMVCIDEKPVPLQDHARQPIPMEPGKPRKVDYEYTRNGMGNIFCAVLPKKGTYINKVTQSKTGIDFAVFLAEVLEQFPKAKTIDIVLDNYSTHSKKSVTSYLQGISKGYLLKKVVFHYTPVHASWLNQAEIAIGMLDRQCLGTARIADLETLEKKTTAWNRVVNRKKIIINWKFNKQQARAKFQYDGKN